VLIQTEEKVGVTEDILYTVYAITLSVRYRFMANAALEAKPVFGFIQIT
jgi:hypothetical protein